MSAAGNEKDLSTWWHGVQHIASLALSILEGITGMNVHVIQLGAPRDIDQSDVAVTIGLTCRGIHA